MIHWGLGLTTSKIWDPGTLSLLLCFSPPSLMPLSDCTVLLLKLSFGKMSVFYVSTWMLTIILLLDGTSVLILVPNYDTKNIEGVLLTLNSWRNCRHQSGRGEKKIGTKSFLVALGSHYWHALCKMNYLRTENNWVSSNVSNVNGWLTKLTKRKPFMAYILREVTWEICDAQFGDYWLVELMS